MDMLSALQAFRGLIRWNTSSICKCLGVVYFSCFGTLPTMPMLAVFHAFTLRGDAILGAFQGFIPRGTAGGSSMLGGLYSYTAVFRDSILYILSID